MIESLVMVVAGTFVLAIPAIAMIRRYRRDHHRAELLRNLDHHDWCRFTHSRRS